MSYCQIHWDLSQFFSISRDGSRTLVIIECKMNIEFFGTCSASAAVILNLNLTSQISKSLEPRTKYELWTLSNPSKKPEPENELNLFFQFTYNKNNWRVHDPALSLVFLRGFVWISLGLSISRVEFVFVDTYFDSWRNPRMFFWAVKTIKK